MKDIRQQQQQQQEDNSTSGKSFYFIYFQSFKNQQSFSIAITKKKHKTLQSKKPNKKRKIFTKNLNFLKPKY